MLTSTERLVETNGVALRVIEAGERGAPVVVLAHGFPELAYSWRHQIPVLAEAGYHVLAPDQRGYGGSSRPEAVEDYDIHALTGDLVGLLDDVGAQQAVFIGHDWGAMVVWHTALLHPGRVRAAAGLSVPPIPRTRSRPTERWRQKFGDDFYMLRFQEPGRADAEMAADVAATMSGMFAGLLGGSAPLPDWISAEEFEHYVTEFSKDRIHRCPELVSQLRPQLGVDASARRHTDHRACAVRRRHGRPGGPDDASRTRPRGGRRALYRRVDRGRGPLGTAGAPRRRQPDPVGIPERSGAVMTDKPLRFGVFITPFHPVGQSPTTALEYDLERTVALDRLGFEEAWFGEHHSGGYELIACPEVFIATAAERTKHIRLGTGVVSLPYHHPLMVADRWVLLDHLTRGRVMFGTGPGALPSDAYMMGIDPVEQRRMMQESLEAILALFRATPDERISRHSDWFTLRDAQLHIRPYTWPYPEISTAAMISPSGPRLAGALGTSLLSLSMSVPGGYAALENTWEVVVDQAEKSGRDEPDRADWRVLSIMHLADTRDQAIDDCTYGLQDFANYFGAAGFVPLSNSVEGTQSPREFVAEYAGMGNCCIGTPGDAIAYIQDLLDTSGGFGTLLLLGHDWASPQATYHSYELFAREVMPHFRGQLTAPRASHDWAKGMRDQLLGRAGEAIVKAINEHTDELKLEKEQ